MKIVDKEQWNRKTSYNTFVNKSNPTFSVTTRLDVTQLFNRCKKEGTSFFTDFLYIVMRCVNSIDEMRMRIKDEEVVIYDTVEPSFVVIKDDDSITSGRISMTDDYPEFYNRVRNKIEYIKTHESDEKMNMCQATNLVYVSCLPWMDFTSVNHPYDYPDKEACSIPRITWGMAVGDSDHKTMAFDVSGHHALMDGFHIYRLVRCIQKALNNPTFFDSLI